MIVTYTDKTYRITYDAVSMIENALDNPNLIQISVVNGCTIVVAPNEYGITYLPNGDFQNWSITGVNTALKRIESHYIYARLKRIEKDALLVFSVNDYEFDGKIKNVLSSEPSKDYYYIKVGKITATNSFESPTIKREISFDGGYLNTPQGNDEDASGWKKLFVLTTGNLINALKHFASFTIKGTLSIFGKISLNEKEILNLSREQDIENEDNDETIPTTLYLQGKYIKKLKSLFLSKVERDKAEKKISLLEGVQFGDNFIPSILGTGGLIDGTGRGYLRSLELYESLDVPELRFNRVSVYTGIRWDTFGGGIIENVEIDRDENGNELQSGIITLKLEEGEFGAIDIEDMAQGIFHSVTGGNDINTEDQRNGNFHFAGFSTSYFRVTEILSESDNKKFRYVLRGISDKWTQQHHPRPFMSFACYANPTNKKRQSCTYTTTEYTIGLRNMTTWEYGENNIYKISGILDGFSLNGKAFQGTGDVIGNGYFYGSIEFFENAAYRMEIDNGGDGFLAWGESTTIRCRVFKAFQDITDSVEQWSVSRESGIQADDDVWALKDKVKNFKGTIILSFNNEENDLGDNSNSISTLFRFTARSGAENIFFELTI